MSKNSWKTNRSFFFCGAGAGAGADAGGAGAVVGAVVGAVAFVAAVVAFVVAVAFVAAVVVSFLLGDPGEGLLFSSSSGTITMVTLRCGDVVMW